MTDGEATILVVEDNPDDRDLLARAFRKAGIAMPLRFAVDGDEAVAYLEGTLGGRRNSVRRLFCSTSSCLAAPASRCWRGSRAIRSCGGYR